MGENVDSAGSCFANRLGRFIDLSAGERAALARLEDRTRQLRRTGVLMRVNDRTSELFLLRRGVLMSFVLLDDGSRQIPRFHFPGDMLGLAALACRTAPGTLVALTDAEVCPFDRSAFTTLAVEQPRLSAAIMALGEIERLTLTDQMAALGRSSAIERVAALLMEIPDRTHAADGQPADRAGDSFRIGLTQEEIGDATGLTAVHVNRMLRQLETDRLIARDGGRVTLLDEEGLAHMANYINRHASIDLSWLPPPG